MEAKLQEIQQLVSELRTRFEEAEAGKFSKSEFAEFNTKVSARLDELETKLNRPPVSEQQKDGGPTEGVKAFWKWMKKGALLPDEEKVMRISEDTTGGYLAPIEFGRRIIELLTEISPIRQIASVERIGGAGIEWPKEAADAVTTAWEDETLAAGDYKWAMEKLTPKELKALLTPRKTLLEDSIFNLEEYLQRKTAEKFAKAEGLAFISGAGTAFRPQGLLTHAGVAEVKTGSGTAVTADGIINLCYALPAPYAVNGKFLMNRKTVGLIRLFKDTTNQYIWQPSYQAGQPATLLGYPIVEAVDMPDVAGAAYPIMFGDFKAAYQIIDRIDIEVQRLVEVYATQGLVGFLFRKRVDAGVVLAEAIRKQVVSA